MCIYFIFEYNIFRICLFYWIKRGIFCSNKPLKKERVKEELLSPLLETWTERLELSTEESTEELLICKDDTRESVPLEDPVFDKNRTGQENVLNSLSEEEWWKPRLVEWSVCFQLWGIQKLQLISFYTKGELGSFRGQTDLRIQRTHNVRGSHEFPPTGNYNGRKRPFWYGRMLLDHRKR